MQNQPKFIYNVTTMVSHVIVPDWIVWMKEEHIPKVMASNCFMQYVFSKVLDTDETEGLTFSVQYFAASAEQYKQYKQLFAPTLRKETNDKWQQQIIAFRSTMEVVH